MQRTCSYTSMILIGIGLFVLALLPRLQFPVTFLTIDEAVHWFGRSETFLRAMQTGDFAATNQTGHPGVTTTWLGSAGLLLYRALDETATATARHPDAAYIWLLRLPLALVHALVVAFGYALLRRLFEWRIALLAALLIATDPFLVAHSQLLHVDALLTSFLLLTLLSALVALRFDAPVAAGAEPAPVHSRMLACSGVLGGLALSTKSPSIILLPVMGLIGLLWLLRSTPEQPTSQLGRAVLRLVLIGTFWGGVALLTWVALWPAAWVDLSEAVMRVVREVLDNGLQPHIHGSFFLGRPVADPGPLFYPVVLVLRLTPWALGGLLVATVVLSRNQHKQPTSEPYTPDTMVVLLLTVLLFMLMMTLSAKKHDRYILPIFPLLNIIAALGSVRLFDLLRSWLIARWTERVPVRLAAAGVWLSVLAGLAVNLLWYYPYYLAYYNPLLGGGPTATRTLVVGWGEGYAQAGRYISSRPDGCNEIVAADRYRTTLQPFICFETKGLWGVRIASYATIYINQVQRYAHDPAIQALRATPPVYIVTIHGIEYAWVYHLVPEWARELDTRFGEGLYLHSYDLATDTLATEGGLRLFLQWQARGIIQEPYLLFVHVLNAAGERVAQVDVPPTGPEHLPTTWQVGRYYTFTHQVPLPVDLPAGDYWLALGVYHPETLERLPRQGGPNGVAPDNPPDSGSTLLVGPFALP